MDRLSLRSVLSVIAVLAVITLAGYLFFGSMVGG